MLLRASPTGGPRKLEQLRACMAHVSIPCVKFLLLAPAVGERVGRDGAHERLGAIGSHRLARGRHAAIGNPSAGERTGGWYPRIVRPRQRRLFRFLPGYP